MAETASTPQERLAQVQEAIVKVLYGGQSYQIGSRKLTRADLSLLREMEKSGGSRTARFRSRARLSQHWQVLLRRARRCRSELLWK